jgi:hypothetical protein
MNILAAIGREEKKVGKQLAKLQRDFNCPAIGGEGSGQVGKPGLHYCQEACAVSRSESKDFKSYQEALGKAQSAGKKDRRLIVTQRRTSLVGVIDSHYRQAMWNWADDMNIFSRRCFREVPAPLGLAENGRGT